MKNTIYAKIFCLVMLISFITTNLSVAKTPTPEDVLISEAPQEIDVQLTIGGNFVQTETDFTKIKFLYLEFKNSGEGGTLDRVAPSLNSDILTMKLLGLGMNVTEDPETLSKNESSVKIEISVTPIRKNPATWFVPERKISKMGIKITNLDGTVLSMTSVSYSGMGRSANLIPGDAYIYLKARLFPESILQR